MLCDCFFSSQARSCSLTLFNSIFLCCAFFLNSNWSFKHIDVSYGSTDNDSCLPFPWHFSAHIMSQRVQALNFFSSIVKYLNNLMVHTIVYRTVYPSTSRCFMDGPTNQMLFITGHVSSTNWYSTVCFSCSFSCSVPYLHAIYWFFHLIYTHLSHQSIKLSLHISLLSIEHYLFTQTYRNAVILMEMSILTIYVSIFTIRPDSIHVLRAHVNHSKSATALGWNASCSTAIKKNVSGVIKDF